jgi:hypothetical protein
MNMKQARCNFSYYCTILTIFLFFSTFLTPASASQPPAEPPTADWIAGPTHVDLGEKLADLNLEDGYIFANAEDTAALLEYMGNIPNKKELGLITPNEQNKNWFIVFRHYPVGYVKDDEKDNIDSAAILNAIQEGTEQANKIRAKKGITPLTINGWYQEPYYDEVTHNLTWTIMAEQDGQEIVNHNVRLLGRQGYISVVLVADVPTLDASMAELNAIVSNVTYKKGREKLRGVRIRRQGGQVRSDRTDCGWIRRRRRQIRSFQIPGQGLEGDCYRCSRSTGRPEKNSQVCFWRKEQDSNHKKTLKYAFGGKNKTATA